MYSQIVQDFRTELFPSIRGLLGAGKILAYVKQLWKLFQF